MAVEVLGREVAAGEDGFMGRGGGARSGSELSHLDRVKSASLREPLKSKSYMGTIALPQSDEAECWCFGCRSLSREASLSIDGMAVAQGVEWRMECRRVATSRYLRPHNRVRSCRVRYLEMKALL